MRVFLLLNKFPYGVEDGGAAVSRALVRDLLKLAGPTLIMAPDTPKHPFAKEKIPVSPESAGWQALPCDTRLGPGGFLKSLWEQRSYHLRRYDRPLAVAQLHKAISDFSPDVCILEGLAGMAFLPAIKHRFPSLPLIYYAHNVEWQVWQGIEKGLPPCHPLKAVYRWIWRSLCREEEKIWTMATLITGVSTADLQYMASRPGTSVTEPLFPGLWDSLPPLRETPLVPDTPLRLYHLGAMDWAPNREGVVYFLRAVWPEIKKAFPRSEFHLAGKNMPASWFSKKLHDVYVHGFVEDKAAFLGQMHICVAPQLSGSGIRIKVLEAMAFGKPVVALPKGAEGLPVADGTHLLVADTPGRFVNHIGSLVSDAIFRRALVAEARSVIARYFLSSCSQAVLARSLQKVAG